VLPPHYTCIVGVQYNYEAGKLQVIKLCEKARVTHCPCLANMS